MGWPAGEDAGVDIRRGPPALSTRDWSTRWTLRWRPSLLQATCSPRRFRFLDPGPAGRVSDPELIALAVAQAITGRCSDRQFLGQIGRLLPGLVPDLPDQTQYNRRLRRLTPRITTVQMMVAELIAEDPIRLVDGTLIGVRQLPRLPASRSEFAGYAAYGYCPSKSQFVWGMRLVVICDINGVPVGYDLVGPKTGEERESALHLAGRAPRQHPVRRRRPLGQRATTQSMGLDRRSRSITPDNHQLGKRPPSEIAKARIRLVIESVFSNLKRQMRLERPPRQNASPDSPNESPNACSPSPSACSSTPSSAAHPRALAAYDGR